MRIFPSWPEIENFSTKLTEGERALTRFLDNYLPDQYKIYVQPHINNWHPDIVVLHEGFGIIVFEVKDWNLKNYRIREGRLTGTDGVNQWMANPIAQAANCARGIFENFLSVAESTRTIGEGSNQYRLCLHAVYFHGSSKQDVESLFGEYSWAKGSTNLVLHQGNLTVETAVPWVTYTTRGMDKSKDITENQSKALRDLHKWLQPIYNQSTAVRPKALSPAQARLAEPGSGFFRVRGAAGTGKSLVIATRAARASQHGRVLVTCFNITMAHVLRDLIAKCGVSPRWENIAIRHFHGFIKDLGVELGLVQEKDSPKEDSPEEDPLLLPDLVGRWLAVSGLPSALQVRGVYIDEGQDFEPQWVDILARLRADNGELVFVADGRQDIYRRAIRAADGRRLKVARFGEGWNKLNKTYRLPWRIAYLLNDVAEFAKLGDDFDPSLADFEARPQRSLLERHEWTNCASLEVATGRLVEKLYEISDHPSDVVILIGTHKRGLQIVSYLEQADQRFKPIQHVFGPDGPDSDESRRRKNAFWLGRGGLKVCTVHSFKGWELKNVLLLWEGGQCSEWQELYVALSRKFENLYVFNLNAAHKFLADHDIWDALPISEV